MSFEGSCHCGAVSFSVAAELPTQAMSCNCSHCRRKGFLLAFVPAAGVTITVGEERLVDYNFNRHVITHRFCDTCGCQPLAAGTAPDGSATAAVNLRCVPEADPDTLEIVKVDGASF